MSLPRSFLMQEFSIQAVAAGSSDAAAAALSAGRKANNQGGVSWVH